MKKYPIAFTIAVLSIFLFACKTKKLASQPEPAPAVAEVKEEKPAPAPAAKEEKEEEPEETPMPSFKYGNIQFEFNSSVLKTFSYPVLDQIAADMKKYPEVKFNLNGHSSLEGTAEYNMALSQERASSVKIYLVNSGVDADRLVTKGYGETKPLASNDTEDGRAKNRRVEIEKVD